MPNSIEVTGIRETFMVLGKIDNEFKKQARRDIRQAVKPLQMRVREAFPASPPLSGMTRGRLAYTRKAVTGVGIKTVGRDRGRNQYYLAAITQNNAAGVIFDMAGKASNGQAKSGQAMIRNLTARNGKPSRAMYPTIDANRGEVIRELQTIMDRALDRLQREVDAA